MRCMERGAACASRRALARRRHDPEAAQPSQRRLLRRRAPDRDACRRAIARGIHGPLHHDDLLAAARHTTRLSARRAAVALACSPLPERRRHARQDGASRRLLARALCCCTSRPSRPTGRRLGLLRCTISCGARRQQHWQHCAGRSTAECVWPGMELARRLGTAVSAGQSLAQRMGRGPRLRAMGLHAGRACPLRARGARGMDRRDRARETCADLVPLLCLRA
jgi:hypothetical protein